MDVMRAEAEVSRRDQDLTVAKTNLQLQESLIKNALTKNLDDPVLEAMPVIPTDLLETVEVIPERPMQELISQALHRSAGTVASRNIDLQQPRDHAQSCCQCVVADSRAGWLLRRHRTGRRSEPVLHAAQHAYRSHEWWGAFENAWNGSSPDYLVGLNLQLPIRNRVAKADQYRSELEYRQAEVREQQLKKQIRIEVRNAEYALEQGARACDAAQKGARPGPEDLRHHPERAGPWARARASRR